MTAVKTRAPEFPGGLEWFNVERPVTLSSLRGRVVLLEMGSFSSNGYLQSLVELQQLGKRFRDDMVVLCVHAPAFPAEQESAHVLKAINRHGLKIPVVHDPAHALRGEYGVKAMPAHVLIGCDGCIVGSMSGVGNLAAVKQVLAHQTGRRSCTPVVDEQPFKPKFHQEPPTELRFPGRLAVARDRIYLSDTGHHRILVTSRDGHVLRQYGGESEGFIDGVGDSAAFRNPQGLAISDEFLFVADTGNHAVRRINLRTDEVVTLAGTGKPAGQQAGHGNTPAQMPLHSPADVACHNNRLFISMSGVNQIWCLSLIRNTLEIFAGSGREGLVDGASGMACFAQPAGLTICGGMLYSVDTTSSAVRCIDPGSGLVTTLVGDSLYPGRNLDGQGPVARLQYPLDIKSDEQRQGLWVADTYNNRICRIDIRTRQVSGLLLDRSLDEPGGLAFDSNTLYIANTNAHEMLRVNPDNGHTEALNVIEEYIEI